MSIDRKQNFKRIAESRTNKILNYIELLGNLSNKSYYDYTNEQIETIFSAIENELNKQKKKFSNESNIKKKFRL
jgi:hypothetical protein